MQPWVIVLISLIGAVLAWRQWLTAHQKAIIDLYDRRYAHFEAIVKSLVPAWRNAGYTPQEFSDFASAMERCRFIFGNDVFEYLTKLRSDLAWLSSFDNDTINRNEERQKLITEKYARLKRVINFYEAAIPIFEPYMKLDMKMRGFFWAEPASFARKQIVLVSSETVNAALKKVRGMVRLAKRGRDII